MKTKINKLTPPVKAIIATLAIIIFFVVSQILMTNGTINRYWSGIIINAFINIILVVSLNIICGFLGQLALGHAGFMAIGAYVTAYILKTYTGMPELLGFTLALIIAGIITGLMGIIVCYPTLRLKGDYLAIITLAFGEVIRNILNNLTIIGGSRGYYGIPGYTTYTTVFVWTVIMLVITYFLFQSRQGRAILAIREDEIAAESSGVNTNKYKIIAFIISAFFAGVAGGLYAADVSVLQPSVFDLDKSIIILVMVVLGGMGSIRGSILGAVGLTVLPELLRSVSDYRMLIYAIILILVMLYRYDERLTPLKNSVRKLFSRRKELS